MAERVPVTPTLFTSVLWSDREDGEEEVKEDYELCQINFETEAGKQTVYIIPISFVNKKLLVAVPYSAWSRTLSERILPRTALTKAVLVELESFAVEEFGGAGSAVKIKAWVGYLRLDLAKSGCVGEADDPTGVIDFEDEDGGRAVPFAEPLMNVANELFAFHTATSGFGAELGDPEAGDIEARFSKLEEGLEAIRLSLEGVPRSGGGGAPTSKAAPAERKKYPGLDPGVLQSARQAGIPEVQLEKLSVLMQKPTRMEEEEDVRRSALRRRNVLSESEDEEEEELIPGEAGEEDKGPAVEQAVVQLTRLVTTMQAEKKKRSGLEAILDRADSGGGGEGGAGSSGGRSKAAAYKKLKEALEKRPEWLYRSIEKRMEEDFHVSRSAPGASERATSTRAWIEHRSKLQHFPSTIRTAWILGGVHDCLRAGNHAEARARCALAVAAIDQSSLDSGNWMLAQEYLLEEPAPYSAFVGRKVPELSEQATTKLIDERFLEVMVWRLKDRDNYIESRRRLYQAQRGRGSGGDQLSPGPPKNPPPKAKPKPKQKWGKESSQTEAADRGE